MHRLRILEDADLSLFYHKHICSVDHYSCNSKERMPVLFKVKHSFDVHTVNDKYHLVYFFQLMQIKEK